MTTKRDRVEVPEDVQKHVRTLLKTKSVVKVSEELGIGREAVTRLAAGLEVKAGTISLVREKMT